MYFINIVSHEMVYNYAQAQNSFHPEGERDLFRALAYDVVNL